MCVYLRVGVLPLFFFRRRVTVSIKHEPGDPFLYRAAEELLPTYFFLIPNRVDTHDYRMPVHRVQRN